MTKYTKKFLGIVLVTTGIALGLTGCLNPSPNVARPTGAVELIRPEATVTSTNPVTGQVEIRVTPPVYYTNFQVSPVMQAGVRDASLVAQATGIPYAGLATEVIGGLGVLSLGWLNWANKRKLRGKQSEIETLSSVADELVDNINTARTVIQGLNSTKDKELKAEIQQSQVAAGPNVASVIRQKVSER
jgi:hypothetical protein